MCKMPATAVQYSLLQYVACTVKVFMQDMCMFFGTRVDDDVFNLAPLCTMLIVFCVHISLLILFCLSTQSCSLVALYD